MSSLITYGVILTLIGVFGIVITTSQKSWFEKEWLKLTKKDLSEKTLNIIKYVSFVLAVIGFLMLLGGIYLKTKAPPINKSSEGPKISVEINTNPENKRLVKKNQKKGPVKKKSKGVKKKKSRGFFNVKRKIYRGPQGSKYYTTRNSLTHKQEKHYI